METAVAGRVSRVRPPRPASESTGFSSLSQQQILTQQSSSKGWLAASLIESNVWSSPPSPLMDLNMPVPRSRSIQVSFLFWFLKSQVSCKSLLNRKWTKSEYASNRHFEHWAWFVLLLDCLIFYWFFSANEMGSHRTKIFNIWILYAKDIRCQSPTGRVPITNTSSDVN